MGNLRTIARAVVFVVGALGVGATSRDENFIFAQSDQIGVLVPAHQVVVVPFRVEVKTDVVDLFHYTPRITALDGEGVELDVAFTIDDAAFAGHLRRGIDGDIVFEGDDLFAFVTACDGDACSYDAPLRLERTDDGDSDAHVQLSALVGREPVGSSRPRSETADALRVFVHGDVLVVKP